MITASDSSGMADMLVWYKTTNYSQKDFLSDVTSMCILKTRTWTIIYVLVFKVSQREEHFNPPLEDHIVNY